MVRHCCFCAICCIPYFVHMRVFRKVWVDDDLVIFAWSLFFISAVSWQTQIDALYTQFQLLSQSMHPTPEIYRKQTVYFQSLAALIVAFYTCVSSLLSSDFSFFSEDWGPGSKDSALGGGLFWSSIPQLGLPLLDQWDSGASLNPRVYLQ